MANAIDNSKIWGLYLYWSTSIFTCLICAKANIAKKKKGKEHLIMKTILTWKVSWKSFHDSLTGSQPHFESLVQRLKWLLPKGHSVSSGTVTDQLCSAAPLTGRQTNGRINLRRVSWRLKQDWNLQPSTPECLRSFLVLWEIPHWLSREESDMNAGFLLFFFFQRSVIILQKWKKGRDPRSHPAHHKESSTTKVRDSKSHSA